MIKIKIKCIKTEGYMYSKRDVKEYGDYSTSDYSDRIKLGKEYCVYGVMLYEDEIDYLIYDEFEQAIWFAAELFEVVRHKVPITWVYRFYGFGEKIYRSAIWSYKEMVFSDKHYEGIVERYKDDLNIFYKRKEEIDSFWDTEDELEEYQHLF